MFERACGDLNLAHYRVLAAVAAGERRASQVAQRLALGKPTVSASVDALCRRGLLRREPSADDQRVVVLQLTAVGEKLLAETEAAMLQRLDNVLRRADDRRAVLAALTDLGAAVDELVTEQLAARMAR